MKIPAMAVICAATLLTACTENSLAPERAGVELSAASSDETVAKRLEGSNHGGRPLYASMDGPSEVPTAGDPDGSGTAIITLNYGQREVCWELAVEDIESATAAHIHAAPAGVPGGVVVPLSPPTTGSSSGCATDVDRDLIKAILQTPSDYYVNVHNATYPAGAVRGQLSK
jgi:hypothetical protein